MADGIAESLRTIHQFTGQKLYQTEAKSILKELGHSGKIWLRNGVFQEGGYSEEAVKFFRDLIKQVEKVDPEFAQDLYDDFWISSDVALADGIAESLRTIHYFTGKKSYQTDAKRILNELGHGYALYNN